MRINELLKLDHIRCPLNAETKDAVVQELTDLLANKNLCSDAAGTFADVMRREGTFGATDWRQGIAFPHVLSDFVTEGCLAVGKCKAPVPWQGPSKQAVEFVFLLLSPTKEPVVESLVVLDGLFSNATARALLKRCQSKEDIYHLITRIGVDLDVPPGFELNRFLEGHTDVIQALAWSTDGRQLASAAVGRDHAIRIWDTTWEREGQKSQPLLAELNGHQDKVDSLAWSRKSARLASASQDRTIILWDPPNSTPTKIIRSPVEVHAVAYSPDDRIIAAAGHVQGCRLYNATSGDSLAVLSGDPLEPAVCISWSPKNHFIAAGGSRATPSVNVWRGYAPYEQTRSFKVQSGFLRSVAWSPNGSFLCAGCSDGSIVVWDTNKWEHINTLRAVPVAATCVDFSHDSDYLAVKYADGTVLIWQVRDCTVKARLLDHDSYERQYVPLSFHPRNLRLATLGGQGRCLRLWQLVPINFHSESDVRGAEGIASAKRVFIAHGRDQGLKNGVVRFIEALGLEPVILHEQADQGQTVIEKLEREARVGFAVVLCTADDVVGGNRAIEKGEENRDGRASRHRARQNVIFELGYFVAKIGRSRVSIVMDPDLEIPSDLAGVVYIHRSSWKTELIKALTDAEYSFTQERTRKALAIEV